MADSSVEIALIANAEKLIQGFRQAQGASKRFFDGLERNRAALRATALIATGALAGQLLMIKKWTKAAGVQADAENKLRTVVGASADEFIRQAGALQEVTRFGDEAIIEAQALLATYGVTTDKLRESTKATLDFAAATGRDLKTAALTVGKAVGAGFTGELSRYGIILDTSTIPKTEVATAILDKLNDQFGGRAAADLNTYAGRVAWLSNIQGDLNEALGRVFVPLITDIIAKVGPLIKKAIVWIDVNKRLVLVLGTAVVGGTGLLAALSTFGFLLAGLPALMAAMTGPIGVVVLGVVTLVGAIALFASKMDGLPSTMEGSIEAIKKLNEENAELQRKLEMIRAGAGQREFYRDYAAAVERNNTKLAELKEHLRTIFLAEARLKIAQDAMNVATDDGAEKLTELSGSIDSIVIPALQRLQQAWTTATVDFSTFADDPGFQTGMEDLRNEWDNTLSFINNAAQSGFGAMTQMMTQSLSAGEDVAKGLSRAFAAMFIAILKSAIQTGIAELIATTITEKGKAFIKAPLTFGASLIALAPIAAAGAAAIAALSALEGRIQPPSFLHGGVTPGGLVQTHPGEVIFNPKRNTMADLDRFLGQAGAGGLGGSLNFYNYGPIASNVDIENLLDRIAERMRQARTTRAGY